MIIQKILPPRNNSEGLFYRRLDEWMRETDYEQANKANADITFPIKLEKGEIISFDSYVNALPVEKWTRFTSIDNVVIKLRTTGKIKIQAYNSVGVYDEEADYKGAGRTEIPTKVSCEIRDGYPEYSVRLEDINYQGVIFPVIEAEEKVLLFGGEYVSEPATATDDNFAVSEEPRSEAVPAAEAESEAVTKAPRPVVIINHLRDGKITQKNVDTIRKNTNCEIPIIIADMTGCLGPEMFIDKSQSSSIIYQVTANERPGYCINKALKQLGKEQPDKYPIYTHAILIDHHVTVDGEAIDRLMTFLSGTDDIRKDLIVQGDILKDNAKLDDSGYVIKYKEVIPRFHDFNLRSRDEYVTVSSADEIDFFKFGLVCLPIHDYGKFDEDLHKSVELDYYLKNKPITVTSLNGFFGYKESGYSEGVIKSSYYKHRDDLIARVDSDLEVGRETFTSYIHGKYKEHLRNGSYELAYAVIYATEDFLSGPIILENRNYINITDMKLNELTKKLNENIINRKGKIKDRVKLELAYNELSVKIEKNYDMIIDEWKKERNLKTKNEREQQS